MKVIKTKHIITKRPIAVHDCNVSDGYVKRSHGSLPDVDCDFERRDEIKAYLEKRYNKQGMQRVFSAGTFTTEKIRSVVKDVARVHKVSTGVVEYYNKIIDEGSTWTDVMKLAFENKKIHDYIQRNYEVFEDILPLMYQPRSAGIHASAVIVVPEYVKGQKVECFDVLPVRKMDGLLVSEISGNDVDAIGLLKNDVLGVIELERIADILKLIKNNYGVDITIETILNGDLNDPKVYNLIRKGLTQGVFQMSGDGITRYIMGMKPDNINDIIASVALFRPGTLDSGAAAGYVKCKNGQEEPEYLWGTYEILKGTFGYMCIAHDTLIKTNRGLVAIQDVNKGDLVQTEDGTYQTVLKTMYKTRKAVMRLRTSFGMELVCTPDHKVLTQRGWVEVQDLRPRHDFVKSYWLTDSQLPVGALQDWCIGLYLANGFWGSTPCITCRSKEDAEKIASLFDEAFGLHCNVYFQTRAWYVCCTYNTNGQHNANPFKERLKELGLESCTCYDKSLDHWTLMTLTGFFEGDGCIANNRMRIKSPRLAKQIFMAAQAAHIHSSYYEDIENNDVVYTIALAEITELPLQIKQHKEMQRCGGRMVPTTYVKGVDVHSLPTKTLRTIWYGTIKRDACRSHTVEMLGGNVNDCWGFVLSVKEDGYAKTYDLSVETNHSFVASGLVVHNCYQEQISQTAQKIGGLSLGDGVNLVKALSKKKLEKVRKFKDKYFEGAKKNGCPKEVAEKIWSNVEDAAKYSFNKSHATAYGLTGYIGAWLKTYYPTAFYTVILKHQDEKKLPKLMNEMRAVGGTTISQPNINISGIDFVTDFNTGLIHWSLSRIKQLGVRAVKYIMDDRDKFGPYTSIEEFLDRIFKYKMKKYKYWNDPDNRDEYEKCPVNARSVKHLILAGAFDEVENVKSVVERYGIMIRAAEHLGFTVKETEIPEDLRGKHYFWSEQQIKLSGMGEIDYERVFNEEGAPHLNFYPLHLLDTIYDQPNDVLNPAVCATITEIQDKTFKDRKTGETKHFGKIQVRQNTDIATIILWPDAWEKKKHLFTGKVGRMFISAVMVKYSDYEQKYAMNITPQSFTKIL